MADPIRKSGSTQPYKPAPSDKNPKQGTGAVPNIGGKKTPTIVKTGKTQN